MQGEEVCLVQIMGVGSLGVFKDFVWEILNIYAIYNVKAPKVPF